MNTDLFTRITTTYRQTAGGRRAFVTFVGTGLASLGAHLGLGDAEGRKKKRKKRCRKRRQSCGGRKKCCGSDTACREFPTDSCQNLTGKRCCGLEGAVCSNDENANHCDCCDGLFCSGLTGEGRCQEEPT